MRRRPANGPDLAADGRTPLVAGCAAGPACRDAQGASGLVGRVCRSCLDKAATDIALLPLDYVDLSHELVRWPQRSEDKIGRSVPGSSPPVDVSVAVLRDNIHWTLSIWELVVRRAAGLAPPARRVRAGVAVARSADLLRTHVQTLADLDAVRARFAGRHKPATRADGVQAMLSLRELHHRARRALGLANVIVRLPGECSGCGAWALRRRIGSETVSCHVCQRRWTYDDYQRYVGLSLAQQTPAMRSHDV